MGERSMAEPTLRLSLQYIIDHDRSGELAQLAQMVLDLVVLVGDNPIVKKYIDEQAVRVLDEGDES